MTQHKLAQRAQTVSFHRLHCEIYICATANMCLRKWTSIYIYIYICIYLTAKHVCSKNSPAETGLTRYYCSPYTVANTMSRVLLYRIYSTDYRVLFFSYTFAVYKKNITVMCSLLYTTFVYLNKYNKIILPLICYNKPCNNHSPKLKQVALHCK